MKLIHLLIGSHSVACVAAVQMRSPGVNTWAQIAAGRRTAGQERGCHCTTRPRGTPWLSDPELRWSTISSFSHQNNKSQPFDSGLHRRPLYPLPSPSDWSFALVLPWHPVPNGLKVQNWSVEQHFCRCRSQVFWNVSESVGLFTFLPHDGS